MFFAWLDKVVGGDLSRSGHSTYDGVISLLLNFFCTFLTLASAQSQSHTVWLLSWTCSLVVTLIVDEIWFFVALPSTLLGSELHGHTAVLLLELIKRQPVTSPADYSLANLLTFIVCLICFILYLISYKATAGDKSSWLLYCQHFIVYQQVQVQVKVHLILPTFYLISACPVSKFAGMWASRNAKGKWDWQRRVWCPMRIRIL